MPWMCRVPALRIDFDVDLYLVRHAVAEPRDPARWPDDSPRPLTRDGIERFRLVARGLRALGVEVDAVLASSWTRAWATAELLREEAGWPVPEECSHLEPTSSPADCLDVLRARSESSLALVGHDPHLSGLGALLLTGSERSIRLQLKKGGVLCLRLTGQPGAAGSVLRWSASPKILRAVERRGL
jgi:phosphohistidine phosphatase